MDAISGIGGTVGTLGGVSGIGGASPIVPAGSTQEAGTGGQSFVNALGDALGSLNTQLASADASMASFASGGSADIQSVMLEMQEASLSLKLGTQVRDRLLEAYHEIMRLQV
jgi:flagellar hook-basal body complex protein FliE